MSVIREAATRSPLYWPPGTPRSRTPERSRFRPSSTHKETQHVLGELERLGVSSWDVIVSTNLELRRDGLPYSNQKVADEGAAVWFSLQGSERVLACDAWLTVAENLRAIALHINAVRGQERWGVGSREQAFRGYAALPPGDEPRDWRVVLGFPQGEPVNAAEVEKKFRALAMDRHPDYGGTSESFAELALSRKNALDSVGRK